MGCGVYSRPVDIEKYARKRGMRYTIVSAMHSRNEVGNRVVHSTCGVFVYIL